MDSLADEALTAFDRVDAIAAAGRGLRTGRGLDRSGRVQVVLSRHGIVSCDVDQAWAARRTASTLDSTFGEAIAAARDDLSRALQQPDPAAELDDLLATALAMLADPQRLTNS